VHTIRLPYHLLVHSSVWPYGQQIRSTSRESPENSGAVEGALDAHIVPGTSSHGTTELPFTDR
jgi:hypothetical protein